MFSCDFNNYHYGTKATNYLLRFHKDTVTTEKKGIWTWIKANILFRSEYHLDKILYVLSQITLTDNERATITTLLKGRISPKKHLKNPEIATIWKNIHTPQISTAANSQTPNVKARLPTFSNLVNKFNAFIISMCNGEYRAPTPNNQLEVIAPTKELQQKVVEFAKGTKALLDPKVKTLIQDFLAYKKEHGTDAEKEVYSKINSPAEFVLRLLEKRPLAFLCSSDHVMQRDGEDLGNTTGTHRDFYHNKKDAALLNDFLSYDEMQIGALLAVSGGSLFINNGRTSNKGAIDKVGSYAPEGVITGTVGCRFERAGLMEYRHMLITPEQNTQKYGYGDLVKAPFLNHWAKFYGIDYFPTYEEVDALMQKEPFQYIEISESPSHPPLRIKHHKYKYYKDEKNEYIELPGKKYLNLKVYRERIRLVYEPYLKDMNQRAKDAGKFAYIRACGIGLGVWAINRPLQIKLMFEVVKDILTKNPLPHIDTIEWLVTDPRHEYLHDDIAKGLPMGFIGGGSELQLFDPINPEKSKCKNLEQLLLCSNYAWDGGSFPGNEYWLGMLAASMDPAIACASQITQLHNPYTNDNLRENILQMFG